MSAEKTINYTVTVTIDGHEGVATGCVCITDPDTWKRSGPPGPDGVSRLIPFGHDGDELHYSISKCAIVALRKCMSNSIKAFY